MRYARHHALALTVNGWNYLFGAVAYAIALIYLYRHAAEYIGREGLYAKECD